MFTAKGLTEITYFYSTPCYPAILAVKSFFLNSLPKKHRRTADVDPVDVKLVLLNFHSIVRKHFFSTEVKIVVMS